MDRSAFVVSLGGLVAKLLAGGVQMGWVHLFVGPRIRVAEFWRGDIPWLKRPRFLLLAYRLQVLA